MRGATRPAMRVSMVMTTTNSRRVIPAAWRFGRRVLFPTDNIRIFSFASRPSVRPVTDNVGFISVVPREFIHIRIAPRVERDFLGEIRAVPVANSCWSGSQRRQAHFIRREGTRVQLVGPERGLESINL